MFEEAAIARKDSLVTPPKTEHTPGHERRNPFASFVSFVFRKFN